MKQQVSVRFCLSGWHGRNFRIASAILLLLTAALFCPAQNATPDAATLRAFLEAGLLRLDTKPTLAAWRHAHPAEKVEAARDYTLEYSGTTRSVENHGVDRRTTASGGLESLRSCEKLSEDRSLTVTARLKRRLGEL